MVEVKCPFCGQADFDLIGLEMHLENYYCDVFGTVGGSIPDAEHTPTIEEIQRFLNGPIAQVTGRPPDEEEPLYDYTLVDKLVFWFMLVFLLSLFLVGVIARVASSWQ